MPIRYTVSFVLEYPDDHSPLAALTPEVQLDVIARSVTSDLRGAGRRLSDLVVCAEPEPALAEDPFAAGFLMPVGRAGRLAEVIDEYMSAEQGSTAEDLVGRYCLVERNVGGSTPAFWVNVDDSVNVLAENHVSQEFARDWEIEWFFDLDTGEEVHTTVTVEL